MKLTITTTVIAGILITLAFAQGPLDPPDGPAPAMKSLSQLSDQATAIQDSIAALRNDSRTMISAAPFTVAASGSYVLGGNLSVLTGTAITINADDVTLDLNGFTIRSTAGSASGSGVLINGTRRNVAVKNGAISGATTYNGAFNFAGFNDGITVTNTSSKGIHFSNLRITGVALDGIDGATSAVPVATIDRCTVAICGGNGLLGGVISFSAVTQCGGAAIQGTQVTGCFGQSLGSDPTDYGINGLTISDCEAMASAGIGLTGTMISNSYGSSTATTGLQGIQISNCLGYSTSGFGISSTGNVSNSRGTSVNGTGLSAVNATNCIGVSTSGNSGLAVSGTASFCRGQRDGGNAISAGIAIGCTVQGSGSVVSPQKHLGTP